MHRSTLPVRVIDNYLKQAVSSSSRPGLHHAVSPDTVRAARPLSTRSAFTVTRGDKRRRETTAPVSDDVPVQFVHGPTFVELAKDTGSSAGSVKRGLEPTPKANRVTSESAIESLIDKALASAQAAGNEPGRVESATSPATVRPNALANVVLPNHLWFEQNGESLDHSRIIKLDFLNPGWLRKDRRVERKIRRLQAAAEAAGLYMDDKTAAGMFNMKMAQQWIVERLESTKRPKAPSPKKPDAFSAVRQVSAEAGIGTDAAVDKKEFDRPLLRQIQEMQQEKIEQRNERAAKKAALEKQQATRTKLEDTLEKRITESRVKEEWQIHKAALKAKFGDQAWNPRKRISPDAMSGVRALHASDPQMYSTERLADFFLITPEAIRRILKSKWTPNEAEVEDRRRRWEKRGERKWTEMVEQGIRPPKKWRDMGVGKVEPRQTPKWRFGGHPTNGPRGERWIEHRSPEALFAQAAEAKKREKAEAPGLGDRFL